MRKTWLAFGLLVATACVSPDSAPLFDSEAATSLDEVLRAAVENGDVAGIVGVVTSRDSILYRAAFGVMDAAGEEPMRPDAIFVIASMTKPITSLGIMMLVDEGTVALDDPASIYLPDLANRQVMVSVDAGDSTVSTRPAARPITVRDLMRHTAGFGYTFSSHQLLEWTRVTGLPDLEQPLLHDPGDRWTYGSNTYFLGRIIEEVSGSSLPQFLESRIFAPLGMTDTSFDLAEEDVDRLVALYLRRNGGLQSLPPAQSYQPQIRGDYGLLSTANDYARFIRLILGDGETGGVRLLSSQSVAVMTRDHLEGMTVTEQPGAIPATSSAFPLGAGQDGFGLGFQVTAESTAGGRSLGSLSWAGLLNTHFWIDPDNGIGVVLLTQLLPFYDDEVIELLTTFESTLYDQLQK